MRKLNTSDVFAAARLIRAAGLREELKESLKKIAGQEAPDLTDIGLETILVIIEACASKNAELAIYEVLAGPFEMEPEKVATLELDELIALLQELAANNDLQSFFKYVSGILGKS